MPIRTWIDHDLRLVRAEVWDRFSTPDILRAVEEAFAYPKLAPPYNVVSDHRRVTRVASPVQLARLMAHLTANRERLGGIKWGIVTGSPAAYGMARMTAAYAERIEVHVRPFTDLDEALAWASPRMDERLRADGT